MRMSPNGVIAELQSINARTNRATLSLSWTVLGCIFLTCAFDAQPQTSSYILLQKPDY